MRILHIDKFYDPSAAAAGGVGSYIRTLSDRQKRAGHDVLRFGCTLSGAPDWLPGYFDFTATRNPLSLLRMVHNTAAARKLSAFLFRRRVDVAHLHNIYHHLTPSILPVLARRGIAMVMTVHDYRLACPAKNFYRPAGLCTRCRGGRYYHAAGAGCAGLAGAGLAMESYIQRVGRRYARWIEFFLCPTEYMRRVIVEAGIPAAKAVVVPLPLPSLPKVQPVGMEEAELLYAGRVSPEKGPDMMLDLAQRLRDAHVSVLGDGSMLDELRRRATERGLTNVTIAGQVERERMSGYYARATAVVIPSRCMENSPLTMLEAMSAGLCVIVPDQPPLRQWVRDGVTGRLFRPADADSLASVAREVLNDSVGRRKMGQAARQLVRRRHEPGSVAQRIEELYRRAIRKCELR